MTFDEICEALRAAGIENYRNEARLLLDELGSCPKKLESAVEKRLSGYPLQYIIKKWWFWDCELEVNESTLIPRADTETVVERALKILPPNARFADLCTGSGCIAVALLHARCDLIADAYELYPETLDVAERNAEKNHVSDRFYPILGDVMQKDLLGDKKYDAIISNPPYIRNGVVDTLDREVLCEPRAALDGGIDGLDFYRAILDNFKNNLKADGCFIFEIGYDQREDIISLASECGMTCTVFRDLGGNDRVALVEHK